MLKSRLGLMTVVPVGGGGWVPKDIDGCALWLQSDLGTVKDELNQISSRGDQSGNEYDHAQATDDKKPIHVSIDGLSVDDYDGIDDWLYNAALDWHAHEGGFSVFLLTKPDSAGSFGMPISTNCAGDISFTQWAGYWGVSVVQVSTGLSTHACLDNFQIVSWESDLPVPSPTGDLTVDVRLNGGDISQVIRTLTRGTGGSLLCADVINAGVCYAGLIDLVLIYNPRLSPGDYEKVFNYIKARRDALNQQ